MIKYNLPAELVFLWRMALMVLFFQFAITVSIYAQECDASGSDATTPASFFDMKINGTATEKESGLMWMRCALGQHWRDGQCSIAYEKFTFVAASSSGKIFNSEGGFSGYKDWRLPTIEELSNIVEHACYEPAINLTVFPQAPVTGYWSSTEHASYINGAYLIHLLTGGTYMGNQKIEWAVRLVRDAD